MRRDDGVAVGVLRGLATSNERTFVAIGLVVERTPGGGRQLSPGEFDRVDVRVYVRAVRGSDLRIVAPVFGGRLFARPSRVKRHEVHKKHARALKHAGGASVFFVYRGN